MVYRFIDVHKNIFGLRWLCRQFGISPNGYYNYKKDAKREYHKRLARIFELIKYVYYNNNRVIGYRVMRIFMKRYGYDISNATMHKYMNKELHLCTVAMHSKPGWKAGCPYDNAPMERFYNTFKSNFYNITSFSSIEMMDELKIKYINWYNYVRPHSYNNYLTPMEARFR